MEIDRLRLGKLAVVEQHMLPVFRFPGELAVCSFWRADWFYFSEGNVEGVRWDAGRHSSRRVITVGRIAGVLDDLAS